MEVIEEVKGEFKDTKLGLVPQDWEIIKFKELADDKVKWSLTGGPFGSDLKSEHYTEEGVRVIQLQNLGDGVFIQKGFVYTSNEKADSLLACNIFPDEIILAKMGDPVTRACIIPKYLDNRYLMGSDGIRLVPDEIEFDKLFVKEYINFSIFRTLAMRHSTGSTRQRIGLTDLKKLPFIKPQLKEQQRIASILSAWNLAIETTLSLIDKLQTRKKGLMQQLLTGKIRLDGFSEDWREVQLGAITERITKKNEELNDTVITISAKRGFVRQEDYFNKRVASKTLSGYYLIEKGDFAYNKSYSKGYSMGAFKRLDDFEKAVVTTLYICFSIKNNIDSNFLLSYFEAGLMVNNLMKIAQEGGRAHGLLNISLGDFFGLKLKIPSKKEQIEITKILNTVSNEIRYYNEYLAQLKEQKKGLMQQLLTGQIRVKV